MKRFAALARTLDDDALAALGNRGLVKRARKDLDRAAPAVEGIEEAPAAGAPQLRVRVEDATVRLALNPASSSCTCPAGGICRHILVAWMFVAAAGPDAGGGTAAPAADPSRDPAETQLREMLAVTDDELRAHQGAAAVRRATAELLSGLAVDDRRAAAGVLAITEWNVEIRWLAGGGLSGSLCSCHAPACLHRVAAILGFQAARGGRVLAAEPDTRKEEETPRPRAELLEAVGRALSDCVEPGLCRLAAANIDRIRTLATSAHGADLPRMERELQGLAGELEGLLARRASASAEGVALRCARLDALRRALTSSAHRDFVGEHRRQFVRVGTLTLTGLGAECFTTVSGYAAVVCYFWDEKSQRIVTWSEARPRGAQGFDPERRLVAAGPWLGCRSPADAATNRGRLTGAWMSRGGRLSGRSSVRYAQLGRPAVSSIPALRNWGEVDALVRRTYAGGLSGGSAAEAPVLLHPAGWDVGGFSDVEQCWSAEIEDPAGRVLAVRLPFTPSTERGIKALESRPMAAGVRVFGRVRISGGSVVVEPVSLLDGAGILLLAAGGAARMRSADSDSAPPADASADESSDEADDDAEETGEVEIVPAAGGEEARDAVSGGLGAACARLRSELVDYAERGTRGPAPRRLLDAGVLLGDVAGLTTVAAAVARIGAEPSPDGRAAAVMRAVYVVEQTERLLAVEQALAT